MTVFQRPKNASAVVGEALQLFVRRLMNHSRLSMDEQLAILSLEAAARVVKPNVDIVDIGELTDRACLIATGLVARFAQLSDGRRQITALYIPGDMADLHSLVHPRVSWALQSLATTTIVDVPHSQLHRLIKLYPRLAEILWRDCVTDASRFAQWVVNIGRRDASAKLAHLFCEMAVRAQESGLGTTGQYDLPMNQTQIAEALGLTSVHINRVLQRLRRENLVQFSAGKITIPVWDRLAELAEFDPAYLA